MTSILEQATEGGLLREDHQVTLYFALTLPVSFQYRDVIFGYPSGGDVWIDTALYLSACRPPFGRCEHFRFRRKIHVRAARLELLSRG